MDLRRANGLEKYSDLPTRHLFSFFIEDINKKERYNEKNPTTFILKFLYQFKKKTIHKKKDCECNLASRGTNPFNYYQIK